MESKLMNSSSVIKMEDPILVQSSFLQNNSYRSSSPGLTTAAAAAAATTTSNSLPLASDYHHHYSLDSENYSSLGFMELLGVQDFSAAFTTTYDNNTNNSINHNPVLFTADPSSLEDDDEESLGHTLQQITTDPPVQESSEVLNTPNTPNSSSISSESSADAQHNKEDEVPEQEEEQEQDQHKTNKKLKPKKTNQNKKQREPRFAFMTKSEVDHLEDGFRWRKYGQKAVKNSPFPRSYYRCTSASCNVKKRVERCFSDPSTVVTTYEGQHTHSSPLMPRPSPAAAMPPYSTFPSALLMPPAPIVSPSPQFDYSSIPSNCGGIFMGSRTSLSNLSTSMAAQHRHFSTPPPSALLADHGLLQDVVGKLE